MTVILFIVEPEKRLRLYLRVNLHRAEVVVYMLHHLAWYYLLLPVEMPFQVQAGCLQTW